MLARRAPSVEDPSNKLKVLVDSDTTKWSSHLASTQPPPQIFFSALGTTRAQAGSLKQQRILEHDLNIELAKTAQAAGTQIYVLISAWGVSRSSIFPYSRMKAQIEEAVKPLGFQHIVLVQPGIIVGDRQESRPAEAVLRHLARGLGKISGNILKDFWAQDAYVIGRAAVNVAFECVEGHAPTGMLRTGKYWTGKVWTLKQAEIVRWGQSGTARRR